MPNRRALLVLAAASLMSPIARRARAQALAERAEAFIKDFGDKLVAVVNGSGTPQAKRPELTAIVERAVDLDGAALFCLGRYWRSASSEQQRRYTALFHQVLVTNILAKLGEYQGVHFTMGRAQTRTDDAVVSTVVERPNNPPAKVDWIVSPGSDSRITDVVAGGTSFRLTQREDYQSYLSHNNNSIDALINAMQHEVSQAL